jgi:hypothetical protein
LKAPRHNIGLAKVAVHCSLPVPVQAGADITIAIGIVKIVSFAKAQNFKHKDHSQKTIYLYHSKASKMSGKNLPSPLKVYLNLPSTISFLNAAKSYLTFCEELIKTPPDFQFLEHIKGRLEELVTLGSNLEEVPCGEPKSWSEIGTYNDGFFNPLVLYLEKSISSDLMCFSYQKPYTLKQLDRQFFVTELFSDMYLYFQDNLYRIQTLATSKEIHAGLYNLKRSFNEDWGPEATILLEALNTPHSPQQKIVLAAPPQPLQRN